MAPSSFRERHVLKTPGRIRTGLAIHFIGRTRASRSAAIACTNTRQSEDAVNGTTLRHISMNSWAVYIPMGSNLESVDFASFVKITRNDPDAGFVLNDLHKIRIR